MSHDTVSLLERANRVLTRNYLQQPIVMARGEGVWLWDVEGRRHLDMAAGVAVSALGHAHPALVRAVSEQIGRVAHVSNLYFSEPQIRLAETLVARSFADRVFLCNSGAEANEVAFKLARRYHAVVCEQPERVEIVAFENSFHGRTSAAVSMTGQPKYRSGFGPLVGPIRFLPYGDLAALERVAFEKVCAIVVEPIQGEGGVITAPAGFLEALRARATASGAVLVFDEVQTGMGRTGTLFAYEQFGVEPDVMTLAKGIAGGVPMGAMLAREAFARAFEPATHASTFGGNPLASAAALAVFDVFDAESVLERVRAVGEHLGHGLAKLAERFAPRTLGTRGRGLMRGLVLADAAAPFVRACAERGLLVSAAGGNVVRVTPPLIIAHEEVDEGLRILEAVLAAEAAPLR